LPAINVSDLRDIVNGYDLKGNQVKATDPRGNSSTFTYDKLDRLIHTTNAISAVTYTG